MASARWAKDHDLPLSRMLREAVDNERRRQQAVAETLGRAEATDLTVEDDEGNAYTARLHRALSSLRWKEGGGTLVEVYFGKDGAICGTSTRTANSTRVSPSAAPVTCSQIHRLREGAARPRRRSLVVDIGLPG